MTANPPGADAPMSEERAERAERWPVGWVASASLSLIALVGWQRSPGWGFIAAAAAGAIAAAIGIRTTRHPRWWAGGATAMLAVALMLAAGDTLTLQKAGSDWARWSAEERENRASRVASSLASVSTRLAESAARVAADSALLARLTAAATANAQPTTAGVSPPLDTRVESALLVFQRGQLIARAGQARTVVPATGPPGIRLVDEPFYASLVARAANPDGSIDVVAVALVSAIPPADRFSRALTQTLAGRSDVASTVVESPDSTRVEEGTSVVVVPDGIRRLARVRALARSEDETRLALLQAARARTGVPLAIAALLILVASWRRPARTVHRWAVTGVLLLAIAVAPFSALSNVSPLFDASSYFAPMGGPLTANVAALLLTTALGLAVLFLTLRSGRVARLTSSRVLAAVLVVVSATLGPFILRDLSRGIALPADGVSLGLWISWQLAIALAGASVLHAGAAVGRTVLGNRRGLPPMTAPSLAIVAAVLAPVLWEAPGGWPAWYPVLWALSILALTLTRRGVALVTGAAVIAGAGATTLTWGATVRARMNLAQYDLARLSAVDENALRLLQRFASAVAAAPRQRRDQRRAAPPLRGKRTGGCRISGAARAMGFVVIGRARHRPPPGTRGGHDRGTGDHRLDRAPHPADRNSDRRGRTDDCADCGGAGGWRGDHDRGAPAHPAAPHRPVRVADRHHRFARRRTALSADARRGGRARHGGAPAGLAPAR